MEQSDRTHLFKFGALLVLDLILWGLYAWKPDMTTSMGAVMVLGYLLSFAVRRS